MSLKDTSFVILKENARMRSVGKDLTIGRIVDCGRLIQDVQFAVRLPQLCSPRDYWSVVGVASGVASLRLDFQFLLDRLRLRRRYYRFLLRCYGNFDFSRCYYGCTRLHYSYSAKITVVLVTATVLQ